ncbi:uncharacterized protein LOC107269315 isoform X1 [Cephus cinctus]|uniref:Uncharacterized protein LOC107269315 isoform X1 n=1 Tax=Cephus cinctus TaxID=211228 RepID=A0AAJ7RJZ9_CEPCN|nr:uncharacterized protein LOC107269315 isoform X1 [Cephus cinctus]
MFLVRARDFHVCAKFNTYIFFNYSLKMTARTLCLFENSKENNKTFNSMIDCTVHDLIELPRTWSTNLPRRHWQIRTNHAKILFPESMPNMVLSTREARFYWYLYSSMSKHQLSYQRTLNSVFLKALNKILRKRILFSEITISRELLRADAFDESSRRFMINQLESQQTNLKSLCLEDLRLKRIEGVRLLLSLVNSSKTMRSLYCWKIFETNVGPLRIASTHPSGSKTCRDIIGGKSNWFKAISSFEKLTTLSLNYAYLATPTGDLLIGLAKKLGSQWQWLQLLCPEDEIPVMADPNEIVRVSAMPDVAWRETRLWAPALKVQYVFIDIPKYDMHKRFYTEATPIHTFALSTGTIICSKQPWHLDCTIKTICKWYPKTLVHLYLQLWHHRERLDTQLKKLFPSLPRMEIFEFVGEIQTLRTLCAMCCQIREKKCSKFYFY